MVPARCGNFQRTSCLWLPFDISQIRAGGIAAMELVSRDLKALGLYQARALSFAGVEYEILKHDLTAEQIAVYDTYADAWAIIHQNLEEALELTGVVDEIDGTTLNSGAKAAARSRFESTKQRFFNQLLLSMKLPTLIAAINLHLDRDEVVVVQLVSTAESILDRRLDSLSPEERAELDLDLSPLDAVIEYLERAFPTQQMQVFVDDTGTQRSAPMFDEEGRPVHNQTAIARRSEMIEHLRMRLARHGEMLGADPVETERRRPGEEEPEGGRDRRARLRGRHGLRSTGARLRPVLARRSITCSSAWWNWFGSCHC